VVVYNALSSVRDNLPVRIPVTLSALADGGGGGGGGGAGGGGGGEIGQFRGTSLESELGVESCVVPATAIASPLQQLQNHKSAATWELLFQTSLPPFSVQAFLVVPLVSGRGAASIVDAAFTTNANPTAHIYRHAHPSESKEPLLSHRTHAHAHTEERTKRAHTHRRARTRTHARARTVREEDEAQALLTTEIENEFVSVAFDGVTGRMMWMKNKEDGLAIGVDQNLHWYESAQAGDKDTTCGDGQQKSGAYIFRPNHTSADGQSAACVSTNCRAVIKVLRSALVSEVQQVFADWATQTVRLYAGMYVNIHVYVYIYKYVYIYICIYIYLCNMYICVYTYI